MQNATVPMASAIDSIWSSIVVLLLVGIRRGGFLSLRVLRRTLMVWMSDPSGRLVSVLGIGLG